MVGGWAEVRVWEVCRVRGHRRCPVPEFGGEPEVGSSLYYDFSGSHPRRSYGSVGSHADEEARVH